MQFEDMLNNEISAAELDKQGRRFASCFLPTALTADSPSSLTLDEKWKETVRGCDA